VIVDVWAIVLAAGSAERFGGNKQSALLGDARLVDRAVATATATCDEVVVVLPAGDTWDGAPVTAAVEGGTSRAASVRSGLAVVPEFVGIVVVHDAAHPLASAALFNAVIDEVRAGADAAVPVLPATETVVSVDHGLIAPLAPSSPGEPGGPGGPLAFAQMPHAFKGSVLRDAHRTEPDARDDASLLLSIGAQVAAVPGETTNVHITTRDELALAERLLVLPGVTTRRVSG
jgi:2-C-methyl-D-erythritol 4-phosphate cytidylyltransferase